MGVIVPEMEINLVCRIKDVNLKLQTATQRSEELSHSVAAVTVYYIESG